MEHSSRLKFSRWLVLSMLFMVAVTMECPPKCKCSFFAIRCRKAGLTEMPKDIPLSVMNIDLSYNPSIRIEKRSFIKFSHLAILLLTGCNQNDPLELPRSLRTLALAYNLFTNDVLKDIIWNKMPSLTTLILEGNKLNVTQIWPLLPKSIKHFDVSGNLLPVLKQDHLSCCKLLKKFRCAYCQLKSIEMGAFDSTREIKTIDLSHNELRDLPYRLFESNTQLLYLFLNVNQFAEFNSTKLKLKNLLTLKLAHNNITSFDFRNTKLVNIGLENNRIRELRANAFGQSTFIQSLSLQNNSINAISQKAFQNVSLMVEVLLHQNDIERLPEYVFNNSRIGQLFLHKNRISSIDGLLLGIKRPPRLLTLFLNKDLQHLNISNLESMSADSKILITCKTLKAIINPSKLKASIDCSPSVEFVFKSQLRFLAYSGYECKYNRKALDFVCRACPPGFYCNGNSVEDIKGICVECPPGSFYQDEVASVNCKSCPLGQFVPPDRSPGKDVSDCQTCPKGTNTNSSAGTRACKCLHGFHRRYRFGACMKCEQNGFECFKDYPQLKKGYWMTWNATKSDNMTKSKNSTCMEQFQRFMINLDKYDNHYDRKTMRLECQLPVPIKCPISGSCKGGIDASCFAGYTGVLCAVCSPGYSKQFSQCIKCPQSIIVVLEFIGYFALFVLFCLLILWTDKVTLAHDNERRSEIEGRTFADILLSSFKILIGFYQILISVLRAYSNINWPRSFLKTVSVLDYIQCEIIRVPSLHCIKPEWKIDSFKEFWFVLSVFFAVPALCLMYFLAKLSYTYVRETSSLEFKRKTAISGRKCMKVVTLFLFVTYPLTSTTIVQILPISCHSFCTAKQNEKCLHSLSYLRSDYSVPCLTWSTHRYTLIAAYFSLIIPLGLPALLWVLLWRYAPKDRQPKDDINTQPSNTSLDFIDLQSEPFVMPALTAPEKTSVYTHALKFAYENYNTKCWYWEVLEMARKLIMTTAMVLFLRHTKIGLSCVFIIAMFFAILHAMKSPIMDKFENFVQLLSLLILPINLSIGAILQSNVSLNPAEEHSESQSLGILLVVINFLLIVLIIGRFVTKLCKKVSNLIAKKTQ